MQQELFIKQTEINILEDLFQAYFDARKNKRNTINALAFEKRFESNLFELHEEIISRNYKPNPSICFVVNKPVKREIFAADFRDRVVHHLIYNYISPIFEKHFINDAYSCRIGKGTHYGINRIDRFIRSCSMNYSKEAYILKLDIKGYFMSINKTILYKKVLSILNQSKHINCFNFDLVKYLIEQTIFNNPTNNCRIKGSKSDWIGLPANKSLFGSSVNCGLPIGNLTSQLFGNIYLSCFDNYVKRDLGIKYYGRYVDDFILIHKDKDYLKSLIPSIRKFLSDVLELELHSNKIYLQSVRNGVKYLGAVIKPYRKYISMRTKGSFNQAIKNHNLLFVENAFDKDLFPHFISSMNSYLGILKHYKTYRLRNKLMFKSLSPLFFSYFSLDKEIRKFAILV